MSGEEDGVEVSYVETESENNADSEDTLPVADFANVKNSSDRLIYVVDGAVLDDSTPTITESTDYSSGSGNNGFGNNGNDRNESSNEVSQSNLTS